MIYLPLKLRLSFSICIYRLSTFNRGFISGNLIIELSTYSTANSGGIELEYFEFGISKTVTSSFIFSISIKSNQKLFFILFRTECSIRFDISHCYNSYIRKSHTTFKTGTEAE